jgi:hypothetical protein
MDEAILKILEEAARKIEEIQFGSRVFEDEVVNPFEPLSMAHFTYRDLVRKYEQLEKDPVMRRTYGAFLRIRVALALSEFPFRQRQEWEWWFMAVYRDAKYWDRWAIANPNDPKQVYIPADPRNWRPAESEDVGHFEKGVWIPLKPSGSDA